VIHAYHDEKLYVEVGYQDFKQWCIEAWVSIGGWPSITATFLLDAEKYDLSSKAVARHRDREDGNDCACDKDQRERGYVACQSE